MENSIKRRPADWSDTDFARKTHREAYYDLIVKQFGNWDEKMQAEFFDKDWHPELFEIILSEDASCGYCSIGHEPEHIVVRELVLSPEFQGKGIGSFILQELIDAATSRKVPVKLQTLKDNQAQHLYRKLGFRDIGSNDTHVELEFHPEIN